MAVPTVCFLMMALVAFAAAATPLPSRPNILFLLIDDLGHYNLGFKGNTNATTPTIDALAKDGLLLNRHYVFKFCSPTRSSFISGRLPVHVNMDNNPSKQPGGVDLRMTTVGELLKAAGYATHQAGKWHAGAYTTGQTPAGRGFDASIGYLNGEEDHFTHYFNQMDGYDFYNTTQPATMYNGTYGDIVFMNSSLAFLRAQGAKHAHARSRGSAPAAPFFLYHAFQNTHSPLQVPPEYLDPKLDKGSRQTYYGMATFVDEAVKNLTDELKASGLWNNTLLVLSSDNGGPTGSGTNYPYRSFKFSGTEGGTRAVAFVGGPVLPAARRGLATNEMIHICDWYATFAAMADVDASDRKAVEAGVPGPDSLNVWPIIADGANSTRDELVLTEGSIIVGDYKLVTDIKTDGYSDQAYPDSPIVPPPSECPKDGCLFNLADDPIEYHDLSNSHGDIKKQLHERLKTLSEGFFQTGADGYIGEYTKCDTWDNVKAKTGDFVVPLCTKPDA